MGMDWLIINSALLHCPHPFSQSRLHGQIQHVRGYETLTLIGVRDRSESWVHTDKAEREQGIQTAYVCVTGRETDGTRGRWAGNTASIVNGMLRFLSVCFHRFDYRQQPPGWCHRLASAKCSSSVEWLGKAQTFKGKPPSPLCFCAVCPINHDHLSN